jgi:xanthine dehydrogenase accessory factor
VDGIIRGLVRNGVHVNKGAKLVEIDPVNDRSVCYIIRDKMRAIAGGALEAIMYIYNV